MSDDPHFPLQKAALVSLFVESLAFGAFSVTYGLALWVLLVRVRRRQHCLTWRNKLLCAICTTMYMLCTTHMALGFARALKGFIEDGSRPNGTTIFYATVNDPMEVGRVGLCIAMTLLADGFMAYRAYVIWNRNILFLIIPAILCLLTGAIGYATCAKLIRLDIVAVLQAGLYESEIAHWIKGTFALTFTAHLLCTTLIASRLVWANYKLRRLRIGTLGVSIWDVIETIIQSSFVHSATLLSLLCAFAWQSNSWFILLDVTSPLLGVTFTLLVTRVGLGYKTAADELRSVLHLRTRRGAKGALELRTAREEFRIQPIEIAVTQSCETQRSKYESDSHSDVMRLEQAIPKDAQVGSV